MISKQDYLQAALSLEAEHLLTVVNLSSPAGEARPVLVKKNPQEVSHILQEIYKFDCPTLTYTHRFTLPVPIKVLRSIRKKLVEFGYVTEKQMEYVQARRTKYGTKKKL